MFLFNRNDHYDIRLDDDHTTLSIQCRTCGLISYNPNDIKNLYCVACGEFHTPIKSDKYVLLDHTPIAVRNIMVWGMWRQHNHDTHVAMARIHGLYISTVFLALNHGWGNGEPVLFETMIFDEIEHHPDLDNYQDRYTTWEEAETGHLSAIAMVQKYLTPRIIIKRKILAFWIWLNHPIINLNPGYTSPYEMERMKRALTGLQQDLKNRIT